jgi:hypothetical protein
MPLKTEKPKFRSRSDARRGELAVVMVLFVMAVTSAVIMADSSKWDSSPTAVGTTVQW